MTHSDAAPHRHHLFLYPSFTSAASLVCWGVLGACLRATSSALSLAAESSATAGLVERAVMPSPVPPRSQRHHRRQQPHLRAVLQHPLAAQRRATRSHPPAELWKRVLSHFPASQTIPLLPLMQHHRCFYSATDYRLPVAAGDRGREETKDEEDAQMAEEKVEGR